MEERNGVVQEDAIMKAPEEIHKGRNYPILPRRR